MNVSNIKSNGIDDKSPTTIENDHHQTSSAIPINSGYYSKKTSGHYGDPMKLGRDKQLLHQAIMKSASNPNSQSEKHSSLVQTTNSKGSRIEHLHAKKSESRELQDGNWIHDESDGKYNFDDASSCASDSAIVGDYSREPERAPYQSYQNTPIEKHTYSKKSSISKQKSSQKHLISRENLMARSEGMYSGNAQYFGYANHKSEDELSSVSVGSAVMPSEAHSRRRRRSSRSTSSSTTISGGRQHPGSGSVTPSSLNALMTPGDSPQPQVNMAGRTTSNHITASQQPFLRDRSLLILGRDETIINTTRYISQIYFII